MFIARKIDDYAKFADWCSRSTPFAMSSAELDEFSVVVDWDENSRTLKRRVYNRWRGNFDSTMIKVLIFRDTTLVSWRDMVFSKRWHKWFENK